MLPGPHARAPACSRVGARHWTLQRNLQESLRWTETFRTPTWTDYLRLNHRLTEADKELNQRVFQLHAGELPPSHDALDRAADKLGPHPSNRLLIFPAIDLFRIRRVGVQASHSSFSSVTGSRIGR
ncbi:MFS transporter [Mesorhizobium sp. M0019]|uniref:MFS transporter n=1 Tax=Mesorhizobium sp. M0019 TaxID=2956845 RepID=UPI00333553DE